MIALERLGSTGFEIHDGWFFYKRIADWGGPAVYLDNYKFSPKTWRLFVGPFFQSVRSTIDRVRGSQGKLDSTDLLPALRPEVVRPDLQRYLYDSSGAFNQSVSSAHEAIRQLLDFTSTISTLSDAMAVFEEFRPKSLLPHEVVHRAAAEYLYCDWPRGREAIIRLIETASNDARRRFFMELMHALENERSSHNFG